jgi:diacylglycerol kinase family enzyme
MLLVWPTKERPFLRAIAIINEQASTVLELGSDIVDGLASRFQARGHELEVQLVSPEEIEKALKSAAVRPEIDAVIVGGGDGSQSLAASLLAGSGKALGVLPLGTMNLLARDLDMPFDLMEAVDALAASHVDFIDLGDLNGRTFHSLAGLGFLARMARERQRARFEIPFARWLAFALALWRAISRIDRMLLEIETESGKLVRRCSAVLVTNNIYRESEWTRERMKDGLLEVHIVRGWTWLPLVKAGFDVMLGRWRQKGRIESIPAREIIILPHRRRVPVSIDGEVVHERTPLHFGVRRAALKVLRPIAAPA